MNRLLNRTLIYYTLCATVILALSSPFFYFMMDRLYEDDVDEAIVLRKKEFLAQSVHELSVDDIAAWNRFNRDIRILPDTIKSKPKDVIVDEEFYDAMTPEWEPYRVLYTDVKIAGNPYVLMIRLNLVESEDLIVALTWLYFTVVFLLLIVIFFVTRITSNRLWRPFYDTIEKINQFNIEQHQALEFAPTRISEFKQLNHQLDRLIKGNLKAYRDQKEFTENAAHELQTPLAVFQSKLDMLLQDPAVNKNQAEILHSLYLAASRLSRVNKNLLLLAKIENKQFTIMEPVAIGNIIKEVLPYFEEQSLSRNLLIDTQIKSEISLNACKPLVEIMISNLILNAISHNKINGSIRIEAAADYLRISNTSEQDSLVSQDLFKRFTKFSKSTSNSGLGLSIVQQICHLHDWDIQYDYIAGNHQFTVLF